VIVSHHTAQAPRKVSPVGTPASNTTAYFTILADSQRSRSLEVHQPRRAVICVFLPYADSPCGLVMRHQPDVSLLTEPGMSHPVSPPLQQGIRFLRLLDPDLPQHALRLACPEGRRTWGTTFLMTALHERLRWAWTPVAPQSRTGTLETCNLSTHANTGKRACDLITPVGRLASARAALRMFSPYRSTLALKPGGVPGGVLLSPFEPNSVHCPWGFAPRHQRDGSTPT
jgi:hypothetical protein